MADLNEHVAYLSQEIGPRPAGTEEEQRAALYISEHLSNEVNLPTTLEDFQCNPDSAMPRALLAGIAVVVTVLALFLPFVVVPAIVLGLICAGLTAAEVFDKPILSRFLNRGVSQNVVAKYVPLRSTSRSSRRRKVVIVANYDSGKVRRDLSNVVVSALPAIYWVEFAALVLMPLGLLVRFFLSPEGTALIAFDVVLGILAVLTVLPVVSFVLEKLADYNEGANCNASGVAVLMDVAARVMAARDLPDVEEALIHGEEAALSAGLVPEGAELVYNAPSNTDELGSSMESATQRLAAAKAAVAALSGKPVSDTVPAESAGEMEPNESETEVATGEESPSEGNPMASGEIVSPAPAPFVAPAPAEPSVPDWFKKGQEQAKKPKVEKPVQRSRYAVALEHAEEEINAHAESQKSAAEELSERVRGMRASVQAASAAAGATPTGVMPVVPEAPATLAAEVPPASAPAAEAAAAPAVPAEPSVPAVPAPAPAVPPVSPSAAPTSVAPTSAAPAVPAAVPVPASAPSTPAAAPLEVPAVPAPAAPAHAAVADDPDISVREGQRPLTGSTIAVPTIAPDLSAVPTPVSEGSAEGARRRLVIPAVNEGDDQAQEPALVAAPGRKRRAISLPKIGVSQELPRISMDDRLQAAPLAEERPASDGRVHDLSAVVPSIAPAASPAEQSAGVESALLGSLPSLGGGQVDPSLSGSISLAGSFSSMGATGAAAPIGDELLENTTAEELYIEDADDSAYREQVTETGAIAGPGYVEMPKSRFGRLFGRKRRKERVQESTPQEWLDVEEDFEAPQVGASRGGWESFRQDEGGQTVAFNPEYFDEAFDDEGEYGADVTHSRRGRRFEGGAFAADGEDFLPDETESAPVSPFAEGLPADFVFEDDPNIQQIEQFHSQRVDIEVWFVALGAELAGNGGMRAFMEAHGSELKGSIIIDLEALGVGTLSLVDKEGTYLPKKASSRMKRLVKKAGQAVGLAVPSTTMDWRDSAAAYAMKHGQQAMHLVGMDGKKPAFFAQADDVIENIDNDQLALNSDFVMELLKHI